MINPREYAPPFPWASFFLRLYAPRTPTCEVAKIDRSLKKLTDEELAWVARVVTAELIDRGTRRAKLREIAVANGASVG